MRRACSKRHGYSMVIVAVFLAMFFSMLAVASQNLTDGLRREKIQMLRQQRDEGSMRALAQALTLLETGVPPSSPYVCGVSIDTSSGSRAFAVTFTAGASGQWQVHVAPANPLDTLSAMPSSFGTTVIIER